MAAAIAIPHTHPVADAGQIGSRLAGVDKSARQFGGETHCFALFIPDEILVAIDRRYPGDGFAGIASAVVEIVTNALIVFGSIHVGNP
jgi:hypothetical protein